jgi:hypothetical protein
MATSNNTNTTGTNNYNQGLITGTGIITSNAGNVGIGTSTNWATMPNYSAGTVTQTPPAAFVISDNPITYDSKYSDRNTYQHEVAVIKITRNDSGEVIKSKMVKVFWVETKTQGSIDYAASKDPEVSEFESEDIIIKTLRTINL